MKYKITQVIRGFSGIFTLSCLLGLIIGGTTSNSQNATAAKPIAANFSNVTLRLGKQKGGWDLQLKLAGLDNFPFDTPRPSWTGILGSRGFQ